MSTLTDSIGLGGQRQDGIDTHRYRGLSAGRDCFGTPSRLAAGKEKVIDHSK